MSRNEENLYASLASALAPEKASDDLKASVLDRVNGAIDKPPPGGETVRAGDTTWRQLTSEVAVKILHIDSVQNSQTALWRLGPGAKIPSHSHSANEECLVLEGKFHVGDHILNAGDFHVMQAGSGHPELTSPDGCLLYIRQGISKDLSWIAAGQ